MGAVFRGLDRESGSLVAIKQLRLDSTERDALSVERFRREGEVLKHLNHPNIVQVLAVLRDADADYLVMELVTGGSLQDLLRASGPLLSVERVLNIGLDLCDALTRSHRLDIIHRDLKPSNVLIAADGTPRLTDFGAAYMRGKERLTEGNAIVGTTEYLSPEILRGEEVDARVDIWSLGVLLFEMLTRIRPFSQDNVAQTLYNITFGAPPDLETLRPDCPPDLVDLVYRMLAKDRNQRVPSARQVAAELDDISHGRERGGRAGLRAREAAQLLDRRRATDVIPNNLRAETSTFIGRQSELRELERALEDVSVRLLTIVAPGGMGKTRIAIELGHRLVANQLLPSADRGSSRLKNGIFFVQLGPLSSPEFIVSAIAEAVSLQFYPGGESTHQLFDHFREKRVLLLLDNFEHLLEGAAIVSELLQAAPGLTVIATSRERLGLSSETIFSLAGMEFPETAVAGDIADSSAVRLFLQGARQLKADFNLADEEADNAVRICRLVQGVPLGIVLAASWAGTLSLDEIAEEISKGLDFLSAELRDLPARQRSMRAVFEHSWKLLAESERDALAALSVFCGGFTRDAAQRVTQASIRTLAALIDKSLLERDRRTGRYDMHALLRQYAEEKLKASPERAERVRDLHAAYFAEFLRQRESSLQSPTPSVALSEIETELDNVRASWARLLETATLAVIARAMEGLNIFHTRRASFAEAEAAFAALVESLAPGKVTAHGERGEHDGILGHALSLQAMFLRHRGRYAKAAELLEEALCRLDEKSHPCERAFALVAAGSTQAKAGNLQQGKRLAEQGLELYRSTGDRWGTANALETLGRLYVTAGDYAEAEAAYRESTELQRASGMLPASLMGLGVVTSQQGNYAEGCRMMLDALELFQSAGDVWNKMRCQKNLANAQRNLGNYVDAEALARASLAFSREVGNWDFEAWSYFQLADIMKEQERYDEAAEQLVAGYERSLQAGDAGKIALAELGFGDLALIRGDYVEAEQYLKKSLHGFESAGQTWGITLALDFLGNLACEQGDFPLARARFSEALRTALAHNLYPFATNIIAGIALVSARTGHPRRAAELLGLTQSHPATERHTLVRRVAPLLEELSSSLSPEVLTAALETGRALVLADIAAGDEPDFASAREGIAS
jgi:predicted ATPase